MLKHILKHLMMEQNIDIKYYWHLKHINIVILIFLMHCFSFQKIYEVTIMFEAFVFFGGSQILFHPFQIHKRRTICHLL